MRLFAAAGLALVALAALVNTGSTARADGLFPWNSVSDSYFTFNVPEGTIHVRVEAEFLNPNRFDLEGVIFWAMPGAKNIQVTNPAGDVVDVGIEPGDEASSTPALVTVNEPLKAGLRTKYTLMYDLGEQAGELTNIKAGAIEALLVSQGPGSFVYIDVPDGGDRYLDPGCLVAKDQGDAGGKGLERWICGETVIIALSGDDQSLLDRCAAADNRCRQRNFELPFSAFAQAITDESLIGRLSEPIPMMEGDVQLTLRYFKSDEAWAQEQFAIAKKAMPALEAIFGHPYPYDEAVLKQSRYIGFAGAAGVAFGTGEMLVQFGSGYDEEVTTHELAHMWAGLNLETKWIWEGLAEYAAERASADVGFSKYDRPWEATGHTDKLANWYNGSQVYDSEYWYGKSGTFFNAYEDAIGGPEKMTEVLARMDDDPSLLPLDAGWFMDQGEFVSGANLDALFMEWVFPETATKLLEQRRAAHDLVDAMQARAANHGFEGIPTDLYKNLLAWSFPAIAGQVEKANQVIDKYETVLGLVSEDGLVMSSALAEAWGKGTIAQSATLIDNQRQSILSMRQAKLELEAAGVAAGTTPWEKLDEAKELFNTGDFNGAKAAASAGVTMIYNDAAAEYWIDLAQKKEATFKAGFFAKIGMMFTDPAADLRAAENLYADGDGAGALKAARSAYDTWNDAGRRGLQRLGMMTAAMCVLCFGVWYILRRMEGPVGGSKPLGQGHYIEQGERKSSWQDWENSGS